MFVCLFCSFVYLFVYAKLDFVSGKVGSQSLTEATGVLTSNQRSEASLLPVQGHAPFKQMRQGLHSTLSILSNQYFWEKPQMAA